MSPAAVVKRLLSCCSIEPVAETMLIVPVPAVVTSAVAVKVMLWPTRIVMWPVVERMSALDVKVVVAAAPSMRMSPVPWAEMAVLSKVAVPSLRTMSPVLVQITIEPLPAVVRMSD